MYYNNNIEQQQQIKTDHSYVDSGLVFSYKLRYMVDSIDSHLDQSKACAIGIS